VNARRPPAARREVGSVARAIALLEALADSESGLGVNDLARRIGVNASTASRLLATLERGGFVERSPGGPYRLGLKLVALSDRVLARLDVRERARPWLTSLVAETGETATLSVPGAREAITVDFVPAPSSVISMARLGRPSVSHATAVGKVMLAFGPDACPARAGPGAGGSGAGGSGPGEQLVAYTERTITDPGALAAELESVREHGIAEAIGEREADLAGMAAPVLGRGGELVAIIGLQGPVARLPAAKRRALDGPLRRAAAEVGRALGGGPGA
jgi:DNA-binding IclR family transcriptional regulator